MTSRCGTWTLYVLAYLEPQCDFSGLPVILLPGECESYKRQAGGAFTRAKITNENIVCIVVNKRALIETMISILGEREAIKELGRRLKLHRLKQNISQQHVADLVGISMPTYRKIEAGVGSVEFRHVARALGVLGFSEALHNLIPEPETNLKLNDLLAPERLKASPRTSK